MQNPKSGSRTNYLRISPKSISCEASHKNSPQPSSCEASNKSSSCVEVSIIPRYTEPTASSCNLASWPPKEGTPKVPNHRSPRSLHVEKGPNQVAELESQISQLKNDLKNTKDQLLSSETSKNQAQKDAEESRQHHLALFIKLEQYQKQILDQSSPERADNLSIPSEDSDNSSSLASVLHEIKRLEASFQMVAGLKPAHSELRKLEQNLVETRLFMDGMKSELMTSKKSESQAKELVHETLMQLETAKKMVETLTLDECKAKEAQDARALEFERLRARINFLEELVRKLETEKKRDGKSIEMDLNSMKLEAERIKRESGQREAELEAGLRKSRYEIEEMMGNITDKENELQSLCEENAGLLMQLENLKTKFKDKERECLSLADENERLKSEIKEISKEKYNIEKEATFKIELMTEEMDKSEKKAARVVEQLEAAQKANIEMEGELRRLKVHCNQWRKAAEVAAAMISRGNKGRQIVERTGSMDSSYISSCSDDYFDGDDLVKKKNGNVMSRFGVLWRKPH